MKKVGRFLVASAMISMLITGCQGKQKSAFSPAENCVYVSKDGSVSSALVESTGEIEVDIKDLTQYLEAIVIRYNQASKGLDTFENKPGTTEKLPAALTDVQVKDGKMTAVFDYASVEDLIKFRQTDDNEDDSNTFSAIAVKGISEADEAGWISANKLQKTDGSAAKAEEIKKEKDAYIAYIEGGGIIRFSGKILYMTEGLDKKDEYTIAVPEAQKACVVFK